MDKPVVFITSTVFKEIATHPKVSENVRTRVTLAWERLDQVARVEVFDGRYPTRDDIAARFENPSTRFVGCHLSHPIDASLLERSNVVAVSTATAGFDHVSACPGVLITHTPGVLHHAVADYTVALILSTLRNVVDLHARVWSGAWVAGDKWDLDGDLSRSLDGQVIGLVGLGEIGKEVARRLVPWGVTLLYHDIARQVQEEQSLGLTHASLDALFEQADIVSLHVPLVPATRHLVGKDLLSRMKEGSLLVNTARGGVLDTSALLDLLASGRKAINVALDVHEQEPVDRETLDRFRAVKEARPDLRFTFMPHNASSDADTRGIMAAMMLEDLHRLVTSTRVEDIEGCKLVPAHKAALFERGEVESFRIAGYWRGA